MPILGQRRTKRKVEESTQAYTYRLLIYIHKMRFTSIITMLMATIAHAIPMEESADVETTAQMQSTIDLANAVLHEAGIEQAERACDINFRRCYMVS